MSKIARVLLLVSSSSLAACVVAPGETEPTGGSEAAVASGDAFSFFVAVKRSSGFAVSRVNGGWMRCPAGHWSATCAVSAIDLSPSGLSSTDAASIVGELGTDPRRPALLFAGRIAGSTLQGVELWRAPEPRRLDGDVLHVSHAPMRALWVNAWDGVPVTGLRFQHAPPLESCALVDGAEACGPSFDRARAAAQSKVGLLAVGRVRHDGTAMVSQYFVKVVLGDKHTTTGFDYCNAEQTECENGACEDDPVLCHAHTGTGRGQLEALRFDSLSFRSWLLFTSQTMTLDYVK